jgi:hypothetical protein
MSTVRIGTGHCDLSDSAFAFFAHRREVRIKSSVPLINYVSVLDRLLAGFPTVNLLRARHFQTGKEHRDPALALLPPLNRIGVYVPDPA